MTKPFFDVQTAMRSPDFYPWVAAVVAGSILYRFATSVISGPSFRIFEAIGLDDTVGYSILMSLVIGAIAGTCQWFIIKRHFRKAYWWIVTAALGYLASLLLLTFFFPPLLEVLSDPSVWGAATWFQSQFADTLIRALSDGLCIGTAQWLFFRRRNVQKASRWTVVTVIMQIFLYVVPHIDWTEYVFASTNSPWLMPLVSIVSAVQRILLATIVGSVTGVVLVGFINQLQQTKAEKALRS